MLTCSGRRPISSWLSRNAVVNKSPSAGSKEAAGKRHLALVIPDRFGALGEHQVVVGGVLKQRVRALPPAGERVGREL